MTDPTPTPTVSSVKFDYSKFLTPGIDVKTLDSLAKSFFSVAGSSWLVLCTAGFKLFVALAYIYARDKLMSQALVIAKQSYEQEQGNDASDQVNGDNLDGS
jgi:hypothetical protein